MSDPKKTKKGGDKRPDPMPSIAPPTAEEGLAQQETLPLRQAATPADPTSAVLGETFGKYRIRRLLGSGGMGAVYLAHDPVLERDVALKVPHTAARGSPESLERFYREARSAGRLQHPNICPVYEVSEVESVPYLTMAFIEGEALAAHVDQFARRPPRDAVALVRILAQAIDEAHHQGVIHRDLKPSNIMMNRRAEPVVMDFGLAREIRTGSSGHTMPGMVVGTPAYMAPEQARGDVTATGPGTDVYSLGVILFELLTGRVPFRGSPIDVIAAHLREAPPPPSGLRLGLDPHADALCQKAMAKEPSHRFLCMHEFGEALSDYLAGAAPSWVEGEHASCGKLSGDVAAEAVVLLRQWGWETGVEKIRARLGQREECEVALLIRWVGGDEDAAAEAMETFRPVRQFAALHGWALLGRAYTANREHRFARVEPLLRQAASEGDPSDNLLQANLLHQRGFLQYQSGKLDAAVNSLHDALALCGREHFYTARVLDTLALVYAGKNNFPMARDLYLHALATKELFDHQQGVGATHANLGVLYLDWGNSDAAEDNFRRDLQIAQSHQEEQAQVRAYHYLGQVAFERAQRETKDGRKAAARRLLDEAADWYDEAIRLARQLGRKFAEGYALKDRGRLCLFRDALDEAAGHLEQARGIFEAEEYLEGLAHTRRAQAVLHRRRGEHGEALRLLRLALAHFTETADHAEATRTQLETARTLVESGAVRRVCCEAYLDALRRAEDCQRIDLVRVTEEELRGIDEQAHAHHVFQRVRGRGVTADTSSLIEGDSEVATTLFLNLQEFVPFSQGLDPEEVMRTLNQMLASLGAVLEKHRALVTAYLGGGFMALFRGANHADRAVRAALDLVSVSQEFNRPRAVLGLRQLPVAIGIASGNVCVGNVGTYHRMDFTALGAAVNLASRLVRSGQGGRPCLSKETHELVGDRFEFAPGNPRSIEMKGIGMREVWDVVASRRHTTIQ